MKIKIIKQTIQTTKIEGENFNFRRNQVFKPRKYMYAHHPVNGPTQDAQKKNQDFTHSAIM